jgi:hypothetical protein
LEDRRVVKYRRRPQLAPPSEIAAILDTRELPVEVETEVRVRD